LTGQTDVEVFRNKKKEGLCTVLEEGQRIPKKWGTEIELEGGAVISNRIGQE